MNVLRRLLSRTTPRQTRCEIRTRADGFGFALLGLNGEIVAQGEGYTRRVDAKRAALRVKELWAGAEIVNAEEGPQRS